MLSEPLSSQKALSAGVSTQWRHDRGRRGLTLIELLVSIAVVGILISLLLPAISAAREAGRRVQCTNHLRQIGIGLHAYHNVHGTLPSGHVADLESELDGGSWGWGALLLPFVEQNPLSESLNTTGRSFDDVLSDEEAIRLLRTNVSVYQCPSDTRKGLSHQFRSIVVYETIFPTTSSSLDYLGHVRPPTRPPPLPPPPGPDPVPVLVPVAIRLSKANYVGSFGNQWKPHRLNWSNEDFEGNGLFGRNSDVSYSKVFDGTSHTLAVGERCMQNYAAVWAGGDSWQGCGFADNQMVLGTAFYPINDAPISQNIDCDGQGAANFSSNHSGGANFVFADGSVHFLSEHLDRTVFLNLAQRDDWKTVVDF